jgi:SAM-dependent methyltransferase
MQLSSATQIDYYEKNADEYCRSTVELDMSRIYQRFLHELNPGAHILDAGCGSGRDSKAFLQRGYVVTAFDGSPQMADFASKCTGQKCHVIRFQNLKFEDQFDAVWACASLLHVPKGEMENVFRRLVVGLKPGGIMYASFIQGEGERVSADGGLYNSYTTESMRNLIGMIPTVQEVGCWTSDEVRPSSQPAPWLNFLVKKTAQHAGDTAQPAGLSRLDARKNGAESSVVARVLFACC